MSRVRRPTPKESSPDWPNRPCSDPAAEKIRLLVLRLADAMGERSQRDVAAEVAIDRSAVSDLLAGRSWPDSSTVARLEVALDRALWPPHDSRQS